MDEQDPESRKDCERDIDYYTNETAFSAFLKESFDKDLIPPKDEISLYTTKKNSYAPQYTGPKAVLNNYKMAQESARMRMEAEHKERQDSIRKMCLTVDADELTDSDDDEIFASIRDSRIKELQQMVALEKKQITQKIEMRKTFGEIQRITQSQYVDFVDSEPTDVFVIILIYQMYLSSCTKLGNCLTDLAKRYPHTKFGKILALDAQHGLKLSITDDALPILCIYKNKTIIHNFTRFQDELREGFDVDDVEEFLQSCDVLHPEDAKED